MIKIDFLAERENSAYRLSYDLGNSVPVLKWDTGAKYTVISAGMLDDNISPENIERLKSYCEEHSHYKENFISASGDPIKGYLVTAHDVRMGNALLRDFHYSLVVENKIDIALLGYDFIDCCKRSADAHGDILISEFDDIGYAIPDGAMENDELISFIDSLSEDV